MQKRVTKRKLQAEDTKNRIFEVAKQLIRENGFENVSIDDVTKGAGISKGAFYVHFESKDSLAILLIEDYVRDADSIYQNFINTIDPNMSITDTLIKLSDEIATVMEAIGCSNMRTLYKTHLTNNTNSASALSYNRDIYILFKDLLEKGIKQGELKAELSADTLAKHCVLALRGVVFEWCARYPDFDLHKACVDHFKILLTGITKNS